MPRRSPISRSHDKLEIMNAVRPLLAAVISVYVTGVSCGPKQADLRPALDSITAGDLLAHIKKLSSDEFEGRSPGTKGEEMTVAFLTDQFKKMGLKPGNPDGTYIQKVPLVGYTSDANVEITASGRKLALAPRTENGAVSRRT